MPGVVSPAVRDVLTLTPALNLYITGERDSTASGLSEGRQEVFVHLEVLMREFYEACTTAMDSTRTDVAVTRLRKAHDIVQPILKVARARLEFHLMTDLVCYLRWTAAWVVYKIEQGKGEWPDGFGPMFLSSPGTTYVYPPTPKNRSSLDYHWSKWKELPETMLPSIPIWAHRWPIVRDKTVYEFARP